MSNSFCPQDTRAAPNGDLCSGVRIGGHYEWSPLDRITSVALILHLTDLHLGSAADDSLDDYKSELVPIGERVTRQKILHATLAALSRHLTETAQTLDAIVISGDITYANASDGFEALAGTLNTLGDRLPPPECVVVVPGNHDVKWRTGPSTPERYANFLTYVRGRGYITPLLDGIDIPPLDTDRHQLLLDGKKVQIVPINSANYCGVSAPFRHLSNDQWKAIEAVPGVPYLPLLEREISALRCYDAARIAPQQLQALGAMIDSDRTTGKSGGIRIALIHHHLLPVSTSEEVKPFESIVNLGALRNFLLAHEFDIVLHGHKHASNIFWDTMTSFQPSGDETSRRILVISGSTLGAAEAPRAEVCRLLKLDATTTAARVTVLRVPAIDPGGRIKALESTCFPLWDESGASRRETADAKLISGDSFDVVYDKLLAFFEGRGVRDSTHNLICEISTPPGKGTLPAHYPTIPGREGPEREEWLRQLVKWWQRPGTTLDNPVGFTHGQRIYKLAGQDHDQLKVAVDAIRQKLDTSRAIISLVGPGTDDWSSKDEAPSFCSVQFVIVRRKAKLCLSCVAYFRKQEMRYWWPVNIGELVQLQQLALEKLRLQHHDLLPGPIITVSAIAVASDSIPKVAVPIVDRLLDEDPDMLWQLAYSLVWPQYPDRDRMQKKWAELLDNLLPPAKPDPDGVPVAIKGLQELITDVERFGRIHSANPINDVRDALKTLLQTNRAYASDTRVDIEQERHDTWRRDCEQIVARLRASIERCLKS
jgi:3',5'-cyclic AMP phosphodiesterase CpdA